MSDALFSTFHAPFYLFVTTLQVLILSVLQMKNLSLKEITAQASAI